MTTVASVWTNAQFLDGAAIKGPALSPSIAAGNVPNFVDLSTGGWGGPIQDALKSGQTPTMAAIDANDRVWVNSTSGQTISLFDKDGKPLSR